MSNQYRWAKKEGGLFSDPPKVTETTAAWRAHAWDGFPREMWNGSRFSKWELAETKEEYLQFVGRQLEASEPCHTSINPGLSPAVKEKFARPWASKLLFELDEPMDHSYADMRKLYAFLKLRYGSEPRIYFSGHRSFHVFVDFMPMDLEEPVETLMTMAQTVAKGLSTNFDLNVFSERHLSRVPFTHHEKTARLCVPISPFWTLDEIVKESTRPQRFEPVKVSFSLRMVKRLREIDTEIAGRPKPGHAAKGGLSTGWIEKLFDNPLGDGRHRALWHILAPYVVNIKKLPLDQAEAVLLEYFLKCDKVRPLQPSAYSFKRLIRYYLKLAERDGYPPWRLDTIRRQDPQLYDILQGAGVISNQDEVGKDG